MAFSFPSFPSFPSPGVRSQRTQTRLERARAIPLVAFIPGLLLWSVETTMLALLDGKLIEGSVDEVAQRISLLLLSAMIWGVLAAGITLVSAVISLCLPVRGRTDALSLRRAFVWAVTGMLLLVFAGAYFIVV